MKFKLIVKALFIAAFCISCDEDIVKNGPGNGVTDIDGNSYKTVKIDGTEWMAENLATTTYNDGASISLLTENEDWNELTHSTEPGYCWVENDESLKSTYGAIYNWYTVESNKLCPDGWHVATDDDWSNLTDYVNSANDGAECIALKSITGWPEGNNGLDTYGFNAKPAGSRSGSFSNTGNRGVWWTSTLSSESDNPLGRSIHDYYTQVYSESYGYAPFVGFSVRCVKD